ncbi:toxin-antitoxin system TumE family protein [Candidatus Electronema sp. JM]|uniref:toxin-antitoxin system TumE family protein n=1 Tax=Candidatus Electronema sp. JM TaxID=3401571 RepID=UPI003AA7DF19
MTAQECLEKIKAKLIISDAVCSITIIAERALSNRGYFRARLTLANGDFLEVSEYFLTENNGCSTIEYRHQWMDPARTKLIKRWDNAPHFPQLANFPHHIHIASETDAVPGTVMGIIHLIELFETELLT